MVSSTDRGLEDAHPHSTRQLPTPDSALGVPKSPRPIARQLLTFDARIPHLGLPNGHRDAATPIPLQPPDLVAYTSPFLWSPMRKTFILILSCATTILASYSAGAYTVASDQLRHKWNLSPVAFSTGITTWAVGFASSPMFLAPLSEINGRRPVFIGSGLIFVVALLGCAVTDSFAGMLVARFFVGAGASTFATMVGGVVSDVYHAKERNTPMAIYSGSALFGTGLGPLCSGFVVEKTSWRWIFYAQVIVSGVFIAGVIAFFKETRGSVLLSRKAAALNKYFEQLEGAGYYMAAEDDDPLGEKTLRSRILECSSPSSAARLRYNVASDEARASLAKMLYLSLTTPFLLLFTEPVVFFFSLWAAFAWGILYLCFNAIPLVFATNHDFSRSQIGAVFSVVSVGAILGTILSVYQEKIAKQYWKRLTASPEGRLYFACLESFLLPAGLFWFGWTSYRQIPWIAPVLGLGCAQVGIFSIYLAVFNYLADVYHRYASSALAAQSFCRNILAAVFPLFTEAMFLRLGFPGASSLLGGLSALLTLVPWVLVFYGPRIRARSRVASEIMASGG